MEMKHDWSVENYREYRNEIVRKAQAKRRQSAKQAGKCICCCARKASKNHVTCKKCRERIGEYYKVKRRDHGQGDSEIH